MSEAATAYELAPTPTALGVARAREELDAARTAHTDASKREGTIKARINVLTEAVNALLARREAGDALEDDAARHALLVADAARLTELLAPASEAARQAAATVQAAVHRLAEAEANQVRHVAGAQAEALEARLRELETLLTHGIAELARLKRQAAPPEQARMLTAGDIYRPGQALQKLVQFGVIPT